MLRKGVRLHLIRRRIWGCDRIHRELHDNAGHQRIDLREHQLIDRDVCVGVRSLLKILRRRLSNVLLVDAPDKAIAVRVKNPDFTIGPSTCSVRPDSVGYEFVLVNALQSKCMLRCRTFSASGNLQNSLVFLSAMRLRCHNNDGMQRVKLTDQKLKDRVALVTGGGAGIGRAIAERYIREGAQVAIADINADLVQKTASEIGAHPVVADVTDRQSIDSMLADVEKNIGVVSVLVNNAAVFNLAPFSDITDEQYHSVFNVNVYGVLFTMQAVANRMVETDTKGNIINMASQAGRRGEPLVAVYCASKAAVISLTQSAGLALIKQGINVNGICLLYTSPSPRDATLSRMPSSA